MRSLLQYTKGSPAPRPLRTIHCRQHVLHIRLPNGALRERTSTDCPDDDFSHDFIDFIGCLNLHEVEFILIGGYAVGAH